MDVDGENKSEKNRNTQRKEISGVMHCIEKLNKTHEDVSKKALLLAFY